MFLIVSEFILPFFLLFKEHSVEFVVDRGSEVFIKYCR